MNMKKILLFVFGLLAIIQLQAQNGVAFNTTGASPDASAIIDASSTSQGILIPRVDIADLSTAAPITSPATSLMVYNTNSTTGPGFFYWDGSNWIAIGGSGAESLNDLSDGIAFSYSMFIGDGAGNASVTGDDNTGVGVSSLNALSSGNNNTALGTEAGKLITSGSSNILIGHNVDATSATVSNELNIGDAIYSTGLYGATAKVGIGNNNNTPKSTLQVGGSFSLPIRSGGTNTTLTENDYTYIVTTASDVTLPTAVGIEGRIYIIKDLNTAGTGNLLTTGTETIDGAAGANINTKWVIKVQSDGSNWFIIGLGKL